MIKIQTEQKEIAIFNGVKGHMVFGFIKDWTINTGGKLYVICTDTQESFTCRHIAGNRYEWVYEKQAITSSDACEILDRWCQ